MFKKKVKAKLSGHFQVVIQVSLICPCKGQYKDVVKESADKCRANHAD